jgi:hypothetical protein
MACIFPHIDVLLTLPFLQPEVQLLAIVQFILHWTARNAQDSTAPEYAIPEPGPYVDALLDLPSKNVEIRLLADIESNSSHLIDAARSE